MAQDFLVQQFNGFKENNRIFMIFVCFPMTSFKKVDSKKTYHQGCAYFMAVNAAILSSANLCDIALIGTASQQ